MAKKQSVNEGINGVYDQEDSSILGTVSSVVAIAVGAHLSRILVVVSEDAFESWKAKLLAECGPRGMLLPVILDGSTGYRESAQYTESAQGRKWKAGATSIVLTTHKVLEAEYVKYFVESSASKKSELFRSHFSLILLQDGEYVGKQSHISQAACMLPHVVGARRLVVRDRTRTSALAGEDDMGRRTMIEDHTLNMELSAGVDQDEQAQPNLGNERSDDNTVAGEGESGLLGGTKRKASAAEKLGKRGKTNGAEARDDVQDACGGAESEDR